MPSGWGKLADGIAEVYVTENVNDQGSFEFVKGTVPVLCCLCLM